jgi:hypothetical protein
MADPSTLYFFSRSSLSGQIVHEEEESGRQYFKAWWKRKEIIALHTAMDAATSTT